MNSTIMPKIIETPDGRFKASYSRFGTIISQNKDHLNPLYVLRDRKYEELYHLIFSYCRVPFDEKSKLLDIIEEKAIKFKRFYDYAKEVIPHLNHLSDNGKKDLISKLEQSMDYFNIDFKRERKKLETRLR